jgi:hypothetical protein
MKDSLPNSKYVRLSISTKIQDISGILFVAKLEPQRIGESNGGNK